ncbi:3-oxoacyl-ACP synthase [Streptomyces tateyamensis]|uniref:3-oxoacyl-ACP synthase n=1 Tax=Streptomyces tateyamensis TaxID=565073 RepID=A0A2V4N7Q1_9ACTN|nr:ketoacyl-ACP synthase III family protein [Streptomyces tateyamensis]PYC72363.1 3-oxoacyl-ACP synthase [Streptomyces tateyamensis]
MKLTGRLGLRTAQAWFPENFVTGEQAVALGLLSPDELAKLGTRQLPASESAAPELALRAARAALAAGGLTGSELDLVVHAWIYHQGHDFWSPAHYLAHQLGATTALPFGIQQMCNGGPVALQTAAAHLLADPQLRTALVTTADRFADPGFDRWRSDYGVSYGDAGTALLLHREPDQHDALHLLSLTTVADPTLETVHRGEDEFSPAPRWHSPGIDVRRTKKAFLAAEGPERLFASTRASVAAALDQALTDAELTPDDPRLTRVLLPRLGRQALEAAYRPALAALTGATVHDLGPDTGHLGAGDTAANLAALVGDRLLAPGEIAVSISGGGGFSWSAVIVQAPQPN